MRHLLLLLALFVFGACTTAGPEDPGGACLTSLDCGDDAACFGTRGGDTICMERCEEGTRLCMDGSVCLMGASGARVCYVGGDLEQGQGCMDGGDCQPGLVCVNANGETRCQRACDTRTPLCGEGQECIVLGAEPSGYCTVPPEE